MMTAARSYLTSVTVLALLVSILRTLTPEGAVRKVSAFAGGLALLAALLRPLSGGRFYLPEPDWDRFTAELAEQEAAWTAENRRALGEQVLERTGAVVEEQASFRGLSLQAEASLRWEGDTPIPDSLTLYSPYDAPLSGWIAAQLDIPPERQTWIGPEESPDSAVFHAG